MSEILVEKRNLALKLLLIHFLLIIALLALTVVRRVFLAMIVNFCLLILLALGFLFFCRLELRFCRYFIIMISVILSISLFLMFVEAFALSAPDFQRDFVFIVNAPILIDIGFVIAYTVIYKRYLFPVLGQLKDVPIWD